MSYAYPRVSVPTAHLPLLGIGVGTVGLAALLGLVAGQSPLAAVALGAAALLAVGIAIQPDVATLAVSAVLYSNAAVIAVQFHGLPPFMAAAVPLLLVAPLGYLLIVRRLPVVAPPALRWIVVYFLVLCLSTLFSADIPTGFNDVTTFVLEGVGLFFMVTNVVRSVEVLRRVVWVLLIVGAALGALSFYQDATKTYSNNYGGFAQLSAAVFEVGTTTAPNLQPRLAGPIGEKNRYAQVMLMLVPLGMFWAMNSRRSLVKVGAVVATGLIAIGVALTFSRGAAVGFVLVAVVIVALGYVRPAQILLLGLGAAVTLVIVPAYAQRLQSIVDLASVVSGADDTSNPDGAILSRATEGLAALLAFADHPLLGVGPGQFPLVYRHYADIVNIRVLAADREAHNLYLGIAAETGIPGIVTFMAIIAVTMRQLLRSRRRWLTRRPEYANIATAFLLSLGTYLATGLFLHLSYARYFWLIVALAAAAAWILEREEAPPDEPVVVPTRAMPVPVRAALEPAA